MYRLHPQASRPLIAFVAACFLGASAVGQSPQPNAITLLPPAQPIESGEIVAWVGSEPILAAEILPAVNELLQQNAEQLASAPEDEVKKLRRMLMQREMKRIIENKLLLVAAKRKIPAENMDEVMERLETEFEKTQMPKLYKSTKAKSRAELEEALAKLGSTVAQQRRAFSERLLASQWLHQEVSLDTEITHEQMIDYYRGHLAEYENEAKVRWEELAVEFSQFTTKAEAYEALAAMGNEVWKGVPWSQVANARSQGVTAHDGGSYDWTTRGALVSQVLNQSLFTIPVGQLSPILETKTGFHILRVIERRDAGRTSFVEAQVDIKKELKKQHGQGKVQEYLDGLRAATRVWTTFDDDPETTTR